MPSSRPKTVSATTVAIHHHLRCDLYLYNSYHGIDDGSSSNNKTSCDVGSVSETTKATMARGNEWERMLFNWLESRGLILRVMCSNLTGPEIQDIIEMDEDRNHFFVAGLVFRPPMAAFEKRFKEHGQAPVQFAIAKPDLVEIRKEEDGTILWRVIDAKSSMQVKTSHHVQIYFYHLCLEHLLNSPHYKPMGTSAIWMPRSIHGQTPIPSLEGLKSIATPLLALPLQTFFFEKLPRILHSNRSDIKWHLNPLCHGCSFEPDCREQAESKGELGSMPNISIADADTIRSFLSASHTRKLASSSTDIEDLYQTIRSSPEMSRLERVHRSSTRKVKRVLKVKDTTSPAVNAARSRRVQLVGKSIFTLPKDEDIAVVISLLLNSSDNEIAAYCISTFSTIPSMSAYSSKLGLATAFLDDLYDVVQRILDFNEVANVPPRAQVYVFTTAERTALQRTLIELALTSDPLDDDRQDMVRTCIGALCEGVSLLSTSFQPLVLSGTLLEFIGKKGGVSNGDLLQCLRRLGLPTKPGTDAELRERIKGELSRLKTHTGRNSDEGGARRAEIGSVPRVVVLKGEIDQILALPVAGYWNLPQCHAVLGCKDGGQSGFCPTDDAIYTAFVLGQKQEMESLLLRRTQYVYDVLQRAREICTNDGKRPNVLVNEARILHSEFMDVCQQDYLRKLFFMQQFEALAKMNALWQDRIGGCPDAPRLEYTFTNHSKEEGYSHTFLLSSGYVDVPTDKERSFYGYILTEDIEAGSELPVEAHFDDLSVFNLVFPLNKYTKNRWTSQSETVQKHLLVADVKEINVRNLKTCVVLRTFGDFELHLKPKTTYRLSPRLVDFNITKVLSTLLEMDLQTPRLPGYMLLHPFLQLFTDPKGFARSASDSVRAEMYQDTERKIQRGLRELANLDHESARMLLLKPSQHLCLMRMLKYRLAVIWGPPGTGKTYTVALSLLRLFQVRSICDGNSRFIVFLTAMTHAAIEACTSKLRSLIGLYRECERLGMTLKWLDGVHIERVLSGNTHARPEVDETYVYAGTVYQLYNFSKKHGIRADCIVIDEAGQLGLGPASLVLRALADEGKVVIAGDSEQLAPILTKQYPQTEAHLFGSILDCLMSKLAKEDSMTLASAPPSVSMTQSSLESMIIQLTENFRLNPDLGEFISTIYKRQFTPQKTQAAKLAKQLQSLEKFDTVDPLLVRGRNILVALSTAMRKKSQTVLKEPIFQGVASSTVPELDNRAISLTLIHLKVHSRHPEQMGYETHVRGEALFAAGLVRLLQGAAPDESIFVATPHRIQRQAVKDALLSNPDVDSLTSALESLNLGNRAPRGSDKVVVDTIERLQGSEASFVICLFAHTYPGNADISIDFLLERRRLNVAISRSKQLCILITSQEVLRPHVRVLADPRSAKGFAFLKAYEDRAWSADASINLDSLLGTS